MCGNLHSTSIYTHCVLYSTVGEVCACAFNVRKNYEESNETKSIFILEVKVLCDEYKTEKAPYERTE